MSTEGRRGADKMAVSDTLLAIHDLKPDQFEILKEEVLSEAAFDSDDARTATIASRINADPSRVNSVLTLLDNIHGLFYDQDQATTPSPEDIKAQLFDVFASFEEPPNDVKQVIFERIAPLLNNPAADIKRKIERLATGFMSNARSFQSIVDFRPVFSNDRSEIVDFITASQFRIVTDNEKDDFVFQVSEEMVSAFRAAVDLLEKKISILNKAKAAIKSHASKKEIAP